MIKIIVLNKIKLFFNISFKDNFLYFLFSFVLINHAAESQKKLTLLARLEDIPEYNKFQCINYWKAEKEGFSQAIIISFPIGNKNNPGYIKVETAEKFEKLVSAINKTLGQEQDKIENVQKNDKIKFPQDQNQQLQQQYQSYQNQQQQINKNNNNNLQEQNSNDEDINNEKLQLEIKKWKKHLDKRIKKVQSIIDELTVLENTMDEMSPGAYEEKIGIIIYNLKKNIKNHFEKVKRITMNYFTNNNEFAVSSDSSDDDSGNI